MIEAVARQIPLQSIIYNQKKVLPQSVYNGGKPLYQAVSIPLPIGNRVRTAYLHCIKLGTNIDPCCGTGTLLIEAAMKATNRAPGLNREFACERFAFMPKDDMKRLRDEARLAARMDAPFDIAGSDIDAEAISLCERHIQQAGYAGRIGARVQDLRGLTLDAPRGVFLCNPPYGERLGDRKSCEALYRELGLLMKRHPGWSMGAITADPAFERYVGRRAARKRRLYNGRLECDFYVFEPMGEKVK